MNLEITVGPEQLVIHQGHSILLTDRDGQIPWPTNSGLYFLDTRMISAWHIFANSGSAILRISSGTPRRAAAAAM